MLEQGHYDVPTTEHQRTRLMERRRHILGAQPIAAIRLARIEARLQLSREPLPQLQLNPAINSIFASRYADSMIEGYRAHLIPNPSIYRGLAQSVRR